MRLFPLIVLMVLLLQACGIPQTPAEFEKLPEAQFLKATMARLVAHDDASIEASMDARVHQPDIHQALERLRATVPSGNSTGFEPAAWNFVNTASTLNGGTHSRSANVAIEYQYPGPKWIVASATLSGEPGNFRIVAFNVERLQAPLAETNAFTLSGKGVTHYLFLVLTAAAVSVSLYAFVRCLRTKGLPRKWLWALFTLIGAVAFSINWTSGAVSIEVPRITLLNAAFMRYGWLGPWGITFSLPVGAFIFLWKHHKSATPQQQNG